VRGGREGGGGGVHVLPHGIEFLIFKTSTNISFSAANAVAAILSTSSRVAKRSP
jgi:hypothetical protein